jgi:hypothetical protein
MLSRLIEWGSRSVYSHAGIAAWWHERLVVFQAEPNGVQVVPASRAVDRYSGEVDWWQLTPAAIARVDEQKLVSRAIDTLGEPYEFRRLLLLAWLLATGRYRQVHDPKRAPQAMFCSQYVSYCFRSAGLDLVDGKADACTSPGDIARCGWLTPRAVLHHQLPRSKST